MIIITGALVLALAKDNISVNDIAPALIWITFSEPRTSKIILPCNVNVSCMNMIT